MFVADLILYLPASRLDQTARSYFLSVDPNGKCLDVSSMRLISSMRLQLGGVLGPVAAVFYTAGFLQLFLGLQGQQGQHAGDNNSLLLPFLAAFGLTTMMVVGGGLYHGLFAWTGFLSAEFAALDDRKSPRKDSDGTRACLQRLMNCHRDYLQFVYKWSAVSALVGSLAFAVCVLRGGTIYPAWMVGLVPVMSGFLKKALNILAKTGRFDCGLVVAGGLTNLWNLSFFVAATAAAAAASN